MEKEKKKRGRKPKGGKIIKTHIVEDKKKKVNHAIILHLKCDVQNKENELEPVKSILSVEYENNYHYLNDKHKETNDNKSIYDKIQDININNKNNITNTTSSCFWCTEPFNSCPIYIPSKLTKKGIDVYGHFCCPECATAYLFNEKIDTSIKWERYSFINNIYNKDYTRKIIPAPSPFYVLSKFYGNLSIEEYRKVINYNKLIIIDKPITKITPEIHVMNNNNRKI
tara:strand:- start:3281 stop:3958 length:678 start_codon:yes stop_codon:yes gene_type:complete